MRFVFTETCGDKVILDDAVSVTIRQEETAPADDVQMTFPYRTVGEFTAVEIFDGARMIFRGIVDEQQNSFSDGGAYLSVSARSLGGLLLDNEAVPATYSHPTAGIIFERHAKGYGLELLDDSSACFCSDLVITKGMSEWQVLRDFSAGCYSAYPRITASGGLYLRGLPEGDEIVFSNKDGAAYCELDETLKRCEEISGVNVKVINAAGYDSRIENPDAGRRGIRRERYLNAIVTEAPMKCADRMIRSSRKEAYSIRLRAKGLYPDILGRAAAVVHPVLGRVGGLYVSAARYSLSRRGEYTDAVLKRRNI